MRKEKDMLEPKFRLIDSESGFTWSYEFTLQHAICEQKSVYEKCGRDLIVHDTTTNKLYYRK